MHKELTQTRICTNSSNLSEIKVVNYSINNTSRCRELQSMHACIIMILGKFMALLPLTLNNEYVSCRFRFRLGHHRRQVTAPSDTPGVKFAGS